MRITLMLMLAFGGCSHLKKQPLAIKSNVPASMKLFSSNGQVLLEVQTPAEIDLSEWKQERGFLRVNLSGQGYVGENFLLPVNTPLSGEIVFNLKKVENWVDGQSLISSRVANDISRQSINIFKLIKIGELEKAMNLNLSYKLSYPFAPVFYEMEGAIHVLNGNLNEAISAYSTALKLDPSNVEVKETISSLEMQTLKKSNQ